MARNKYPERTIEKILDVAFHLFAEKGYEKTTIQDIVDALGMSKGAVYHHFKSKEDIMQALGSRSFVQRQSYHYDDDNLNGLEKLQLFMLNEFSHGEKQELDKMSASILRVPQFMSMHIKNTLEYSAPMMKDMIDEGIKDGSIKVKDSLMTAEVFMLLSNLWANPLLQDKGEAHFIRQIEMIDLLMSGVGMPLLNDELKTCIIDYYRKATA